MRDRLLKSGMTDFYHLIAGLISKIDVRQMAALQQQVQKLLQW